jgi:ankyrin repeat protein
MSSNLVEVADRGTLAELESMIAAGVDLDQRDARGRTAMMAATHADRADVVRTLIEAGADVDLQDDRRDNVFLYAGAEGRLEILRLAVKAGASTTLTNRYGGSALIPAAEGGHTDVVREILTTTDVDVNHVNKLGWTALLEAIILSDGGPKHQGIVRLLLEHGADVDLADKDGISPLEHAKQRGYREIERMLLAAGAH